MSAQFLHIAPVLPSEEIPRDVAWYEQKTGFKLSFADSRYAVLCREDLCLHLQWHANTEDDPLLGGSVIRIFVQHIRPLFEEFVQRGTVTRDALRINTPWGTHEFGFFDLNRNAIFIVEDVLQDT